MRTINREIVGALIWSADERLLMGKRGKSSGGVYPDVWHIPGGGIEAGESQIDALIREVHEETGIKLEASRARLVDAEGSGSTEKILSDGERVVCDMKFFIYETRLTLPADAVALTPGEEFDELRWFEKRDLSKIPLVPAGPPLFQRLGYVR